MTSSFSDDPLTRWTSGGLYHQHGWVNRAQTTSSVDVRCPVQALSKVRRRCSMKTAVGQNAQPECDSLRNSQPMEFTKQWGYAFWLPRWENQTGGGIQDGLQPVLQMAGDTSENWVAVVHQCTNQGQQGMSWRSLQFEQPHCSWPIVVNWIDTRIKTINPYLVVITSAVLLMQCHWWWNHCYICVLVLLI